MACNSPFSSALRAGTANCRVARFAKNTDKPTVSVIIAFQEH